MAGRARPRLRVLHRKLLVRLARDDTATTRSRSALVLAPHADDETIGCGGTILAKTAAGTAVRVVIAADGGDPVRRAECVEACRRLGVHEDDVKFLGFPDGALGEHVAEIVELLRALVRDFSPSELYAPSTIDAHPDHRALATAVDRLVPSELRNTDVFAYPVWFWNRWAWVDRATPRWQQRLQLVWRPLVYTATTRTRVVRTEGIGQRKRHALDAHASQVLPSSAGPGREVLDPEWLALFLGPEELFFRVQEPHAG